MKIPVTSGASSSARRTLSIIVLATSAALLPAASFAEVPGKSVKQVPGYYHMSLGDFQVTALYDGAISLTTSLLKGISDSETQAMLADMFVPVTKDGVQTAVNGYLVNTGKDLILVDAGAATCFGPTLGGLGNHLKSAGYETTQVSKVFLTHLHGDHSCGITADGKMVFPNATVYVTKGEADYWLNKETAAQAPKEAQPFFQAAQEAVAPYETAGKLKQFVAGDALADGVTSVPLAGHTPGHEGYMFSSKGQQLLVWGDIVHSHAVQFANPAVSLDFDTDKKQAVATREKVFARAAKEKFWIGGAHLPFPGIGHVKEQESGYRWIAVEYSPLPAGN
ncbi:MBL fold metallo-hydrolase [Pollutimonas subterranea]|uniref:MBL fold metallo-hydrolase n=1 Tax=Pollutimonas subterranea TaxID=2045210 RepID=A0A2N4U8M5_9BURK|nr:MBL fold metallo-hydrolase [Pollutimonas subterranea]PLC51372.1 MBL fold metallo-hydrolase [Pollutimonas subterranea]